MIVNGQEITGQAGKTLLEVLKALEMNPKTVVVEQNGIIITRESFEAVLVQEADQLEVVSFVGGG